MTTPPPGQPDQTAGPQPSLPWAPPVPDDRVHGDSVVDEPTSTVSGPATAPAHGRPPRDLLSRQQTRPARSRKPWAFVAIGAALLATSGLGLGPRPWGSADQQDTLMHPIDALRVNASSGDVTVLAGAAPGTVEVTRHLRWGPGGSAPQPRESWQGNTLDVQAECTGSSWFAFGCSVDYTLKVPNGVAVTVDAGSGDLSLSGSLGDVSLKTGSGDIEADRLAAPQVEGRTGSGDVELDLASAPNQLSVNTGSGDVGVTVPKSDSYAVNVQTGSGDDNVRVNQDSSSPRTMQVKTGSGDIDIDYR